jgi:hypothetical protein
MPHPRPFLTVAHRFLLASLLVLAGILGGRDTRADGITAALERDIIAVGDSTQLFIDLEGDAQGVPNVPDILGLQITRSSTSRQIQILNGAQSVTLKLGYTITASRIGTYSVGPFTARIGGSIHSANPIQLRVVAANDPAAARKDGLDRAAFVELVLPRSEFYVGESFLAEAHLYAIGGQVEQAPQITGDGFTLGKAQNLRSESNIRTNDRIYGRVRYMQAITAARTGDLQLEANNCVLSLPISRRQGFSDAFDELFGGREVRRLKLSAQPVTLKVLNLPREGQPARFNGAVGDFRVSLTASPTNLQAGDPMTLRIEISGSGNFDSVNLPEQPAWKAFRAYPPIPSFEPQDGFGFSGVKRFEQALTPESSDTTELPPFEFSFFDPNRREYRTVRTAPIPIRVAPGASTPTLPAPAGTQPGSETAATAAKPSLTPLKPHLGTAFALAPVQPWIWQPWFLGLNAVPILAWFGLRTWRRVANRRAADSQARQRELLRRRVQEGLRSLENLSRSGNPTEFHSALFRVLQDAVAARTGQPPSSITEGSLETDLVPRGVSPETIATFHALFQACNQARYARQATPGDLQRLQSDAAKATSELVR